MVAQRLYDELFALPPADQVEVLRRLSDRLGAAPPAELSDDVRRLLDERIAAFEQDESAGLTWDETARLVAERIAAR